MKMRSMAPVRTDCRFDIVYMFGFILDPLDIIKLPFITWEEKVNIEVTFSCNHRSVYDGSSIRMDAIKVRGPRDEEIPVPYDYYHKLAETIIGEILPVITDHPITDFEKGKLSWRIDEA